MGTMQYSHVLHLDADCVMIKPVDELFEMQVPFMCAASVPAAVFAACEACETSETSETSEGFWPFPEARAVVST